MLIRSFSHSSALPRFLIPLLLTKAFQTPKAVPSNRSSPTKTGIEARYVKALDVKANEDSRIGAKGCTVVKPIRTNTTIYNNAVHETMQ